MDGETSAFAHAVQGFENIDKGGKTPACCDDSTMIALLSGVNRFSFSKIWICCISFALSAYLDFFLKKNGS